MTTAADEEQRCDVESCRCNGAIVEHRLAAALLAQVRRIRAQAPASSGWPRTPTAGRWACDSCGRFVPRGTVRLWGITGWGSSRPSAVCSRCGAADAVELIP